MKKPESVTVIGAGPTGLTTAYFLAKANVPVTIVEKTQKVGGMAASFEYTYKGQIYTLDYGPHKFFTQIDGVYDIYREVLGNKNIHTVKKRNAIRIKGQNFDFPVSIVQLATRLNPLVAVQIGLGVIATLARSVVSNKPVKSFEEYFIKGFGKYGYGILFRDYAKKVWGDPKKLSEELARKRVPVSSAFELIYTMLKKPDTSKSADTFLYPKHRGFGHLSTTLEKHIRMRSGLVLFDRSLSAIKWKSTTKGNKVTKVEWRYKKSNAQSQDIDYLVSTIPLHLLPAMMEPRPPKKVLDAAKSLTFRGLRIFYLFFDKKPVMTDNWRFYPEETYIFNRVSEMNSFSTHTTPKGKAVLMAEVTCGKKDKKATMSDDEMYETIVQDLIKAKVIQSPKEVEHYYTTRAPIVYPVYDLAFRKNLDIVLEFLGSFTNLLSVGRAGLFNYNNTDHCLDMGKRAAQWILEDQTQEGWQDMLEYFDSYAIVD